MFITGTNETHINKIVKGSSRQGSPKKMPDLAQHLAKDGDPDFKEAVNYIWNLLRQPLGGNPPAASHSSQEELLCAEVEQLRQQLQASEARFRNVIDKNADAIVIVDGRGKVRFANPSAECLFNCSAAELLSQELFGTLVVERQASEMNTDHVRGIGATAVSDMRVVQAHVDVRRAGGDSAVAEMRIVETEWEGERAFLASLRDITEGMRALVALRQSEARLREQTQQLEKTLGELRQTQAQLVQSEKMSALGQLVAGVAHEINNPVNFITGNLSHASHYTADLLGLLQLYQKHYPEPVREISDRMEDLDFDFMVEDLPKLLDSMKGGAERIRQIVLSLRTFSRLDQASMKRVDIHEGLESTVLLLQNRLKGKPGHPEIQVVKDYGQLPLVECYAGELNQVFMNILTNAIDALEMGNGASGTGHGKEQQCPLPPQRPVPAIRIRTEVGSGALGMGHRGEEQSPVSNAQRPAPSAQFIRILIADSGPGIAPWVKKRLFDPFFTTKPVGAGTGLGLFVCYQIIVEKHGGVLRCVSEPGQGAEFAIEIPIRQSAPQNREKSRHRPQLDSRAV
ncbi:MAG: PAS domain-containing sensor histidine kinase [Oscillatoria princeps RMCB-10]|jgi:PAS domain S-box-containing protein|nr:PAS domain-containing sensor histidine kinase [Oscillatoria princeps RMCB-10]